MYKVLCEPGCLRVAKPAVRDCATAADRLLFHVAFFPSGRLGCFSAARYKAPSGSMAWGPGHLRIIAGAAQVCKSPHMEYLRSILYVHRYLRYTFQTNLPTFFTSHESRLTTSQHVVVFFWCCGLYHNMQLGTETKIDVNSRRGSTSNRQPRDTWMQSYTRTDSLSVLRRD